MQNYSDTNLRQKDAPGNLAKAREFLVVSTNVPICQAVGAALSTDTLVSAGSCNDLASLPRRLDQHHVDLVFVDLDGSADPARFFDRLETVTSRHIHTRFIVLANELSAPVVIQAMQAGARHVQLKSSIPTELDGVVRRLMLSAASSWAVGGAIISVFSASGGCGTTTIAMNLAHELKLASERPVLLVDLDYAYGALMYYLGVSARYGVADVLNHPGDIDPQLVSSTVAHYEKDLHVLMSPANGEVAEASTILPERLDAAIQACKATYGHTVVDAPRVSGKIAASLAEASSMALIVMQASVKDIRVGKARIAALLEAGMPPDRIRPILNRHRKRRQMISLEEAQQALGAVRLRTLSNDYPSVIKSINHGKPLAAVAPRSILRREIYALAQEVDQLNTKQNGVRSKQW